MFEKIKHAVERIRNEKPLVLNITNAVTIDFVANGLLSVGASPVMSESIQDAEDLIALAHTVVINLGTLDEKFMQLCHAVCKKAAQLKKPIVLDPVGAGATRYRTESAMALLKNYPMSIVRGNASEVMALSGYTSVVTKGVDSSIPSENALESASFLSRENKTTVVASGAIDLVVEGDKVVRCDRGSAFMPCVTGTGCLLSAMMGAFHAIEKNSHEAASLATFFYAVCGEIAAQGAEGPASFKVKFLDALHADPKRNTYEKK